jgi:hypothetical protein
MEERPVPREQSREIDPQRDLPALEVRRLNQRELIVYTERFADMLTEEEAGAVLDNPNCTSRICQLIAQNSKVTSYYSIRAKLVVHRATPQGQALKFVRHLYWTDLLRYSIDVRVHPAIRRAIDVQLNVIVGKLTLGEKISAAKSCSHDLLRTFLFDSDPKVFTSVLINPRLREDDLLTLISTGRATIPQLELIASNAKWSFRYPVRRALVLNRDTPNAIAASQLRFLTREDLRDLARRPQTSTYIRRCIEKLLGDQN